MTNAVYDQTWDLLDAALKSITYKDSSRFGLFRDDEANYARLDIFMMVPNSYTPYPREDRYTRFEFVVPVATYDIENWARWVFERIRGIETHEMCEWFQVDGVRVYAPHHANGEDPFVEWHLSTAERAAKSPGEDN